MAAHTHPNYFSPALNALPPGEYLSTKELAWRACCSYAGHAKKPSLAAFRNKWGKGNPISWGTQSGATVAPSEAE